MDLFCTLITHFNAPLRKKQGKLANMFVKVLPSKTGLNVMSCDSMLSFYS